MNIRSVVPAFSMASLVLGGCVSVPADRGVDKVQSLLDPASESTVRAFARADAESAGSLTQELVTAPIGPDEAVQLALLNNPVMRQLYGELGIAQADVYDASRLSNPTLGYLQLSPASGGVSQRTWSLTQNFTELLFIGYRTRVGKAELLRAQQRVAQEVMRLEADVRTAYYDYVGTKLAADTRQSAAAAADLAAELAERFHVAGNISALQLSREQAAVGAATISYRQAQSGAMAAAGKLFTALGLPLSLSGLTFIEDLPLPVAITSTVEELQARALRQRLDLQALRTEVSVRRDQLGHAQRWRWLGGLAVTAEREKELDGQVIRGGGASVEVPIFNSGRGSLLRAQGSQESAEAALLALELRIANEIAVQVAALDAARATVDDYQQRLVPLRESIVSLSQQQQNYMLIGAFDVLAARREEMEARQSYVEALRDYWITYTGLESQVGGPLSGASGPVPASAESGGVR